MNYEEVFRVFKSTDIRIIDWCYYYSCSNEFLSFVTKKGVVQSKNHDVTLENKGITLVVADFSKPILGKAIKRSSLIVLDQPVSTKSTVNDMKFENMGILKNINIFQVLF